MKKMIGLAILVGTSFLFPDNDNKLEIMHTKKTPPSEHLLTIENNTDHKLFIVEGNGYRRIKPHEAITLFWKEPLCDDNPRKVAVYYGGNINQTKTSKSTHTLSKAERGQDPILLATIKTNQPGTVSLFYSRNGVLRMNRLT